MSLSATPASGTYVKLNLRVDTTDTTVKATVTACSSKKAGKQPVLTDSSASATPTPLPIEPPT